ncbi:hypothetical protein LR48_Vigan221s002800 [Vigna angularis]|uniref:Putative plant transposon protein domain-containing protein n=1 Tax=Phaseolus angularis TaxID=3914 RepID=A0A0L9T6V5_PHAAN|nr:hypothetical protein LR48_Vigan221s002800 [Vigna angularis]
MTSSSGKRIKTLGTKDKGTKRKEKEQFYSNKFRTPAHERYFPTMEGRRLLMERKEGEQCHFAMFMMEGVDYEDVEQTLCVPGGNFQINRSRAPIHIIRPHLTPLEKYWLAFSHANIQPCSHVSDITVQRAIFLYYVLRGLNINIGQVIADEIQSCTRGASSKAPLGHPSLITHLCEATGIELSRPPLEHPRKELDAAYFTHYCAVDEPGHPVPPPQQPRVHRRAPPLARSQFMRSLLFRCGTCTFISWILDWLPYTGASRSY